VVATAAAAAAAAAVLKIHLLTMIIGTPLSP